jgi:outer membrane protein OmpA-like peptidoglycan-associated protein
MKFKTVNMTKWALCFGFASLANFSQAQEAFKEIKIGFESAAKEVSELQTIELAGGEISSPTMIKADLFSKEASNDVGIPNNIYGTEETTAEGGENVYAGIVAYKPGKQAAERSYITIPIAKKGKAGLTKGMTYCVEYSISLSESSKFACNNLGLYFTDKAPAAGESEALYADGDHLVKSAVNGIYNGYFGWDKVCNIYIAKGDEKFITIGNFDRSEKTLFQSMKKPKDSEVEALLHAYYYVDNIIIRQIEIDPKTKQPKLEQCECYNKRPPKVEDSFSTLVYDKTPEINEKMTLDKKIAAQTIYFRAGKTSLTENAVKNLDFIAAQLNANPSMTLEVIGHNDPLENKAGEENEKYKGLDLLRIKAVKDYLTGQGIDADRLFSVPMSDSVQSTEIAEDDDQETKDAKNRRVEFRVKL